MIIMYYTKTLMRSVLQKSYILFEVQCTYYYYLVQAPKGKQKRNFTKKC